MRPTTKAWTEEDETAETERPPAPNTVWRCDGEDIEPAQYATLIEATGEKPKTPDAIVAGGGALLAESDEAIAQWVFTEAGMERLAAEMQGAIERDSDTVVCVLLDSDLRAVGS